MKYLIGREAASQRISVAKQKSGNRCFYCGREPRGYVRLYIDHVIPRSRSGSDEDWNLVAACNDCNGSKGADTLEQFRLRRARERAGWPYFQPAQLKWLLANATLPPLPEIVFYGETLGWKWSDADGRYLLSDLASDHFRPENGGRKRSEENGLSSAEMAVPT